MLLQNWDIRLPLSHVFTKRYVYLTPQHTLNLVIEFYSELIILSCLILQSRKLQKNDSKCENE